MDFFYYFFPYETTETIYGTLLMKVFVSGRFAFFTVNKVSVILLVSSFKRKKKYNLFRNFLDESHNLHFWKIINKYERHTFLRYAVTFTQMFLLIFFYKSFSYKLQN